jgi:hypothetical protein
MATRHHASRVFIAFAAVFLLGVWRMDAAPAPTGANDDALRTFNGSVEAYMALHRGLAHPLPMLDPNRGSWSHSLSRRSLASAIRGARATAKQGDIFLPTVADLFRNLIANTLADRHPGAMFDVWPEESWPADDPVVNEPFPNGASHAVPAELLHHLPALPNEIEYRIVNGILVLLDVHADIVIDVLPDAFRVTSWA